MAGADGGVVESEGCGNSVGPKDGPVLNMMNKRLRALKKKYNRILQIEENKAQGKSINREQEEVLKTKIAVAALIDEYEKLRQPLCMAVKEELAAREKELMAAALRGREEEESVPDEKDLDCNAANRKEIGIVTLAEIREELKGQMPIFSNGASNASERDGRESEYSPVRDSPTMDCPGIDLDAFPVGSIADLLKLLYFAHLFDVRPQREAPSLMWTKVHERSSCLSYDFVTEDSTCPLREEDLDALSLLGSLVISRPPNDTLSHKDALKQCVQHAILWLQNSDAPILSELGLTYSHLRERLNRILFSEYFTMAPELQMVSQETAAAAATVAGQYATKALVDEASLVVGSLEVEEPSPFYTLQDQASSQQQFSPPGEEFMPSNSVAASISLELPNSHDIINSTPTYTSESSALHEDIPQLSTLDVTDQVSAGRDLVSEGEQVWVQQQEEEVSPRPKTMQQQPRMSNAIGPRGYQGPRGRGMGYGGRGRGYANGRGRGGRGAGYLNGRGGGQSYDQAGYYTRNYYGRGSGRNARGMPYNVQTNGPATS
eukprot:c28609_g2_i1 orf=398-2038(+)